MGLAVVMAWVKTMTNGVKDGYRRILIALDGFIYGWLDIPIDVFGLFVDFAVTEVCEALEVAL